MLKEYPKFRPMEIEEFYAKLPQNEKEMLKDYLAYRKARGITTETTISDIRRYVLHMRYILEKDIRKMDLREMRNLLAVINTSWLSGYAKNDLKTDLKNLLKYLFTDWSSKFANLEDIRLASNVRNEKKLNSQALFQQKDIEKIMTHETSMFWKAFFLTQYEGGLRTQEVRFMKWQDISFNVDGDISEISIYASKTKKSRTIFVKDATFYLMKLQTEQENMKQKGLYIFHAKKDTNKPITKSAVAMWFRTITKKALGRQGWNYLLRHSRATELYRLAKQGKIAKDTAIEFMGHSEDMSKVYSHFDKKEIKEMLKNQVYKLEDLPEEKKHELEKEIAELRGELKRIWEQLGKTAVMARKAQEAVEKSKNAAIKAKSPPT